MLLYSQCMNTDVQSEALSFVVEQIHVMHIKLVSGLIHTSPFSHRLILIFTASSTGSLQFHGAFQCGC